MMGRQLSRQSVFRLCIIGLAVTSGLGAVALSVAEDIPLGDGLWLCFSVITTVGFGEGPVTAVGRLAAVGCFVAAAACWFGLLLVAVETGLARYQRTSLLNQALEPLARSRGPRLFDRN